MPGETKTETKPESASNESEAMKGGSDGTVFKSLDEPAPNESLSIERLSEEHATVRVTNGSCSLVPGDLVRVLPNHSGVVSNLVDCVWLVSGTDVVDQLEVSARGRIA